MAMNVGSSGGEDAMMMEINTTPLIDVMLVLLIYLIISLPPTTHAVKLDMPRGEHIDTLVKPEVIELEVDFDGTYLWNGTPVADFATRGRRDRRASGCPRAVPPDRVRGTTSR